ncbi:MAG: heme-binding protein [Gammaproteobacteria bacterium]|jgi:uncharacterized protein GlcG (DUF336 family)
MNKLATTLTATLIGLGAAGLAQAEEPMAVSIKRLSMETAEKIAHEAVLACRKQGISVTATVVDRGGSVQAVLRDTKAPPVSVKISRLKAYTAANFNVATSQMSDRANSPLANVKGLLFSAGGLPIQAGGYVLGAVGVSGAPSGKTDESCAAAGIKSVADDLEMSM